jgi:hypothetical protein
MKVVVRKGTASKEAPEETPVVLEVWMSQAEAKALPMRNPGLEVAAEDALEEHLRAGYRTSRAVRAGRHA